MNKTLGQYTTQRQTDRQLGVVKRISKIKPLTSPFLVGPDIQRLQILVARSVRTVLAGVAGTRVEQVPPSGIGEGARVLGASLPGWRVEPRRLRAGCALDRLPAQRRREHASYPVGGRVQPIYLVKKTS